MGLASTVQRAAKTAFKVIGDVPVTCTYTSKGAVVYVPATGAYSSTDTDYTGIKVLFENYTTKEITDAGGVILSTDQKASIPNLNLTPTPKIKDVITDADNQKWTVENIMLDAARALWILQTRRSA